MSHESTLISRELSALGINALTYDDGLSTIIEFSKQEDLNLFMLSSDFITRDTITCRKEDNYHLRVFYTILYLSAEL